jgi:hypothetical protein
MVIETTQREQDPGLGALETLSDAATSSASELVHLDAELTTMRRRRRRGWSWSRIISSNGSDDPLATVMNIVTTLGRASGEFRRALARSLRDEGMRVTEIASLFGVSRQRVSALLRRSRAEGVTGSTESNLGSSQSGE